MAEPVIAGAGLRGAGKLRRFALWKVIWVAAGAPQVLVDTHPRTHEEACQARGTGRSCKAKLI